MPQSRHVRQMCMIRHCNLSILIFVVPSSPYPLPFCFCIIFCFVFVFLFRLQEIVWRISYCDITHTKHIPQGGVNIKASVWGYNPFEMHLSVITHRQGWSRAWLWGTTLPRCLAQTLTLPGLQQGLHAGILVSPLSCVPTNYLLKDSVKGLIFIVVSVAAPCLSLHVYVSVTVSFLSSPLTTCFFLSLFLMLSGRIFPSLRGYKWCLSVGFFVLSILKWPLLVQKVNTVLTSII